MIVGATRSLKLGSLGMLMVLQTNVGVFLMRHDHFVWSVVVSFVSWILFYIVGGHWFVERSLINRARMVARWVKESEK